MKHIFKKSLENRISKDILYSKKKKLGFNAPERMVSRKEEDVFNQIQIFCKHSGALNFDEIKSLCKNTPRHMWRFYVLSRWYNLNFIE